jgi:beta-lactam-binding protein with PASTA domain
VKQGSTVKLELSSGKRRLPDVTTDNMKCSDAKSQINGMGWSNVHFRQGRGTSDHNKVGDVNGMQPTPGHLYPQDQKITLFCFKYKAPPPTCDSNSPPPVSTPITTPTGPTSSEASSGESSTSAAPSTSSTPSSPVGSNGLPFCNP